MLKPEEEVIAERKRKVEVEAQVLGEMKVVEEVMRKA